MEKKNPHEPLDYVAQMRNMNEMSRKNKRTQLKWLNDYEWLCDEYKNLQAEMQKLCEERDVTEKDDRSVGPVPKTTNGSYGWLGAKNEFILEKYGSYFVKYPNPLDDVALLSGDVPRLAAGKGLLM